MGEARSAAQAIEAIPENLFREPLDLLYADHFRQRIVCNLIEELARIPADAAAAERAAAVVVYLEQDLPLHVADEEEDLFPRLRARCRAEDRVEAMLTLLSAEHAEDDVRAAALHDELRALAVPRPGRRPSLAASAAEAFVLAQRRHLAWENALLLPLARQRLTHDDLAAMGRRMAARRGATFPE